MELRCLFPELKPMVGYAVTCTADSTSAVQANPDRFRDLFDAIEAMPKPAVVVIQNCGPDRLRSCFIGDMMSVRCQKLGAVGVVTDGGIRDLTGIRRRAPGFLIFAPGSVVSHGNCVFVEVGIPVSVAGLRIEPGDLLHGDESGVVKVPIREVEAVLENAELVRRREQEWFDCAKSGALGIEEMKRHLAH
jgi:regulator of RNase E activity RraA